MTEAVQALVALGSNLSFEGSPPAGIVAAALEDVAKLGQAATGSRLFRSPAWPPGGPEYVNAAMSLRTTLAPEALLDSLHAIEARWGRERTRRWGARTLDLDLLAWDDAVRPDAATQQAWRDLPLERQGEAAPTGLILPHPRLQDRGFVLLPLVEVAADWRHPLIGRTIAEMLEDLPPAAREGVMPLAER